MRDGYQTAASVAFFSLRDLGKQDANTAFSALWHLHRILEAALPKDGVVRVTSALYGAVVVVPEEIGEGAAVDLRDVLPAILRRIDEFKLPVRVGVAHGGLEYLHDVDDNGNFIGPVLNIAARLSFTEDNDGILFHESFVQARSGHVSFRKDVLKISDVVRLVAGKEHDEPFRCFPTDPPVVMGKGFPAIAPTIGDEHLQNINGVAVAFDLPKFSAGDRAQLGHRFRGFVAQFKKVRGELADGPGYYAPGGDGGILVFTGQAATARGVDAARKLDQCLQIEGGDNSAAAGLRCRMGLHYGSIALYQNAEGVLRPTGRVCFIADRLAGDQQPGVIVYSRALRDQVSQGNDAYFDREFRDLPAVPCPPDGDVRRFVATSQFSPPSRPSQSGGKDIAEVFDKIVATLQSLVDASDNGGLNKVLIAALYRDQPPKAPAPVSVSKIVGDLGPGEILLRIAKWLRVQGTRTFEATALGDFCGGISIFAVDPAWVAKCRSHTSSEPFTIPDAETVFPNLGANLHFLLLLALQNIVSVDVEGFDFARLLAADGNDRRRIPFSPDVVAGDITSSGAEDEIKRIVVLSVYRETPHADLKKPAELNRLFEKAREEMLSQAKLDQPYFMTYPAREDERAFLANLSSVRLWNNECGFLLREALEADGVVRDIIHVVNCVHEVRKHIDRLSKLSRSTP